MSTDLQFSGDLPEPDRAILRRLAGSLNLLADLSCADLLLVRPSGSEPVVVAESRPEPVPSLHRESQVGRVLNRGSTPLVHRILYEGRSRHHFGSVVLHGVPTMQEVFAIRNQSGETIAALCSDMAMLEHERLRKRSALYRQAIARVRELAILGRLEDAHKIGRLGVHDGVMVIDGRGQIQYISAVAEHLYRRLGYGDTLVKTFLSELDTNEYVCFRAMERGLCLEQRVQEKDLIWIKKAVPLSPIEAHGLIDRLPGRWRITDGAVIVIQDVTDEVRKEQELRIKSAMMQEIHHRVKNNLQTIAALLRMQARRTSSDEVSVPLHQAESRIQSVAAVHAYLAREERAVINIHEVATRIIEEVTHGTLDPSKDIKITLEGVPQLNLPGEEATSCALIINELLQNAVEHGYRDRDSGTIQVRLDETDDSMVVEIRDDGAGLPEGFSLEKSSLGLQIVDMLVREQLKGHFALESEQGVRALVTFPRWRGEGPLKSPRPVAASN